MLDRILNRRAPIVTYGEGPSPTVPDKAERISGRIVVESPVGVPLAVIGAFDTEYRFQRKLTLTAPEGRFRVAIYGNIKGPRGKRDFVARSPLMMGL